VTCTSYRVQTATQINDFATLVTFAISQLVIKINQVSQQKRVTHNS